MNTFKSQKSLLAAALVACLSSEVLSADHAAPGPYDFLKRVPISVSAVGQAALGGNSVSDVPVLVRISESIPGFSYNDLESDGSDIAFGVESGDALTIYPHEIETWSPGGVSLIWVKVPTLSAATEFAMYYGNGVSVADSSTNVWSNYVGVWHLNEASGDARDATGHGLKAVPSGANSESDSIGVANCPVGTGRQMASDKGRKSYLAVANNDLLDCGNSLTFSGWFKAHGTSASYSMRYVSRKSKYTDKNGWEVEARYDTSSATVPATTVSARGANSGDYTATVPDIRENWVHLSLVYDDTKLTYYVNGVPQNPVTLNSSCSDNDFGLAFGNNPSGGEPNWWGLMDELRLSSEPVFAEYAVAEYHAMTEALLSYSMALPMDETMPVISSAEVVACAEGFTVSYSLVSGTGSFEAVLTDIVSGEVTSAPIAADSTEVVVPLSSLNVGHSYDCSVRVTSSAGNTIMLHAGRVFNGSVSVAKTADADEGLLTPGVFTVTASSQVAFDLLVPYTVGGTAVAGQTYAALSGSVVIPAGSATATIAVNPIYSSAVSDDVTVSVTLHQTHSFVGSGAAEMTIVNFAVNQAVRFVSMEGDDAQDGMTLLTAKKTVRAAIESLEGFDAEPSQIFIAPGTYEEDSSINKYKGTDNANYRLVVTNAVTLIGTGADPTNVVLRNKNGRVRVLCLDNAQAGIRNLTLANGQAYQAGGYGGGNLYIGYDGGSASNCVFTGGCADNYNCHAGNVFMRAGLVTHCVIEKGYFTDNRGDYKAGGIEIYGGIVENCLIHGNYDNCDGTQTKAAAGVMISGGMIRNCTIAANSGKQVGGICVNGTAGVVENCVIVGNTATMADESIAGDVVSYMVSADAAKAVFRNCVVDAKTVPNETCVSASSAATLVDSGNGDFHLAAGSPAINFGRAKENEASGDLDLNERVMGSAIDAGCYEYDLNAFAIAFEADVVSGVLPVDVTFTAVVSGVNDGDSLQYVWDFDGDGVVDATLDGTATAQYQFVVGGMFSPSLTVKNLTAQKELSISKSNYLQFAPRVLYVNKDAESHVVPFATPETGALTVNEAIAAAVDGCEIVIYPGTYGVTSTLTVEKVLDIHGLLPDPEEVVLTREGSSWLRVVEMNKTEAKLSNVVIEKGTVGGTSGGGVHFGDLGGTVSNVVIRGCSASNYNGAGGAAYLVSKHALLTHCVISNCYVQTMNGAGGNKGVLQVEKGRVENCLVAGCYCPLGNNETDRPGNAVHIGANGSVVNCTIVRNTMETRGIVYVSSATSRLINCVVAGNTKGDGRDTVFFGGSVSDPSACVLNCVIDPEDLAGTFKDYANGDYTPNPTGPLYNAGVTPENAPSVDLAGKPRVIGRAIDIGCFESSKRGFSVNLR